MVALPEKFAGTLILPFERSITDVGGVLYAVRPHRTHPEGWRDWPVEPPATNRVA
jgi:hypothetical protein